MARGVRVFATHNLEVRRSLVFNLVKHPIRTPEIALPGLEAHAAQGCAMSWRGASSR